MRVQEAPFFTRPSWKLKEKGVVALDDAELLSLVLWKGTVEESCVNIAKNVLDINEGRCCSWKKPRFLSNFL